MKSEHRPTHNTDGFTIIELMVATLVFASILLLLVFAVIQISRNYYKGITVTQTQNTARTIINQISQAIQFSAGSTSVGTTIAGPSPGTPLSQKVYAICIGNQYFQYQLGIEERFAVQQHVLGTAQQANCTAPPPASQPIGAPSWVGLTELLGAHMRLSQFSVALAPPGNVSNLYKVDVEVVYGDDDLMSNFNSTSGTAVCKGQLGSQFCATAHLSTVVERRLN